MSILNIPEEEKAAIRKQHEEATKNFYLKQKELKGGLKKKEEPKKEEPKKEEPKKA